MPLFFRNKGSTCFFNVACQILFQNQEFLNGISQKLESESQENVKTHYHSYLEWRSSNPKINPRETPVELKKGRRYGLMIAFYRLKRCLDTQTQPNDAHISNVDEFVQFIPCLAHSVQTFQHQDILECVNEIFDILDETPLLPRVFNHEQMQSIEENYDFYKSLLNGTCLESCWGIRREHQKCMNCNEIVRTEYSPFLWIQHVNEKTIVKDVQCDHCNEKTEREIISKIVYTGSCILVSIQRHNNEGNKIHDPKKLNTKVRMGTDENIKEYELTAVAYHEGWNFNGGHYTSMIFSENLSRWLHVNDASHQLQSHSFDICNFKTNCTYAGLYKRKEN
jgi:hypothetical protein